MHRLLTGVGLAAASVLIAASATINYLFMSSLGRTWLEGQVLGTVSVAADVLKAVIAVMLGLAARDGRRMFVVIGTLAFVLFSLASLVAAVGFTAQNRGAVTSGKAAARLQLTTAERDVAASETKLAGLPAHRPVSIVEEALAALRFDSRWLSSKECQQPSGPSTREFCLKVSGLRQELAAAREAFRLEDLLSTQRKRVADLSASYGHAASDPQARLLADALGLDEGTVQRLLMALVALVVEMSSGLGIYLATGHRQGERGTIDRTPSPPPSPTPAPPPLDSPSSTGPSDLAVVTPAAQSPPDNPDVVIEAQASDPLRPPVRRGARRVGKSRFN